MTSMSQFFIHLFQNFGYYNIIVVPSALFKHYRKTDIFVLRSYSMHRRGRTQRNIYALMASKLSSRSFLLNFSFLPVLFVVVLVGTY